MSDNNEDSIIVNDRFNVKNIVVLFAILVIADTTLSLLLRDYSDNKKWFQFFIETAPSSSIYFLISFLNSSLFFALKFIIFLLALSFACSVVGIPIDRKTILIQLVAIEFCFVFEGVIKVIFTLVFTDIINIETESPLFSMLDIFGDVDTHTSTSYLLAQINMFHLIYWFLWIVLFSKHCNTTVTKAALLILCSAGVLVIFKLMATFFILKNLPS